MDHSENDKRFCVYVHKDQEGNVRYVGSGTLDRAIKKTGRSKEHLWLWDSLNKEVLISGLSKQESLIKEELIISQIGIENLLNKHSKVSKPRDISYSFVSEYLEYDESANDKMKWLKSFKTGNYEYKVGSDVVCRDSKGYRVFSFLGQKYPAHRVIWVLYNKKDLQWNLVIDHVNHNKSDNSPENLRAVTQQVNVRNSSREPSKITGVTGIKASDRGYTAFWTENGVTRSRTFSFVRFGYLEDEKKFAFNLACEYRKLVTSLDMSQDIKHRLSEIDSILSAKKPKVNNTSGELCIRFRGTAKSWVVSVVRNKVRTLKSFNIKKLFPDLPYDEAKRMAFDVAIRFRDELLTELDKA